MGSRVFWCRLSLLPFLWTRSRRGLRWAKCSLGGNHTKSFKEKTVSLCSWSWLWTLDPPKCLEWQACVTRPGPTHFCLGACFAARLPPSLERPLPPPHSSEPQDIQQMLIGRLRLKTVFKNRIFQKKHLKLHLMYTMYLYKNVLTHYITQYNVKMINNINILRLFF